MADEVKPAEFDRVEIVGSLIDIVEDFLAERGKQLIIVPDDAIIVGDNYDRLASMLGEWVDEFIKEQALSASVVDELPPELMYQAYLRQQELFRIEDAKAQVEDFLDRNDDVSAAFGEDDYAELARRFLDQHDCNIDENSQWEYLISSYVADMPPGNRSAGNEGLVQPNMFQNYDGILEATVVPPALAAVDPDTWLDISVYKLGDLDLDTPLRTPAAEEAILEGYRYVMLIELATSTTVLENSFVHDVHEAAKQANAFIEQNIEAIVDAAAADCRGFGHEKQNTQGGKAYGHDIKAAKAAQKSGMKAAHGLTGINQGI